MNTLGTTRAGKITVSPAANAGQNMSIAFVKDNDRRIQTPLIAPGELYYNPSTKTLHCDRFSGGIPSLIEGEAVELTTTDNQTQIDVKFAKNTEVITELDDTETLLVSNTSNELKTITALNLKSDIILTAGSNLSYGTDAASNTLSLDGSITSTTLSTGCVWSGNAIPANKLSDGSVSDTEFQRLNSLTSAILQTADKNVASGVCPLDVNGLVPTSNLPGSVSDIIEAANFASLPAMGDPLKIYVTTDNNKSYRWSGSTYFEISESLVLGTTNGTAYDGASGQTNADNIALKQDQLTFAGLSGLTLTTVGSTKSLAIDMQKTTAETSFDDGEFMLIEETTGALCRITKQHLQSSIDTNTEYTFTQPNLQPSGTTISLNTTLTSMVKISSSSGDFEIGSENQIKFYSDENGNNGGGDFVWITSKTSGGMAQQLMRITGSTGNVVMNGESLTLNNLQVDVNAENQSNRRW